MLGTSVAQAGPARRMAVGGAAFALGMEIRMARDMGLSAEALRSGKAKQLMDASRALTAAGAVGTLALGRHRVLGPIAGAALVAGSVCTRFAIFEAGQASARDPRYTVIPQRQRIEANASLGAGRP
jgi:uncharacterized membrane protein YedE/YeeE